MSKARSRETVLGERQVVQSLEDKLQGGAVASDGEDLGKRQTVKGFVNHIKEHGSVLRSQGTDDRDWSP